MSDRLADEPCDDCGRPAYEHERQRTRQEDGQYVFRYICPE
ncbi:hypothetical protein [Salarchaeum japonicum]|uniref:Small CPxCG-related zinc finger protein n=1 Tax=Salarchaeum japonicum TaxID=555573 RepID=A0AAV3T0A7_9EURY|nr:hypothetical protein [Salarchaeum japonicum]